MRLKSEKNLAQISSISLRHSDLEQVLRNKMHYLLSSLSLLLLLTASSADDNKEQAKSLVESERVIKKLIQTIYTDKYRLIWNGDPTSTMTIGWNQHEEGGYVLYGLTALVSQKQFPGRQVYYRDMDNQFVRLKNLQPNSRYYFKICTQSSCSETMYFKTAPKTNQGFTFVAGGDSRSIPKGRIRGNILISKIRPLFIAHGGDYTHRGTSQQWSRWLEEWQLTKSADGRMYPLIVTHGNHENYDREMLYNIFDVPNKDVYYKIKFPLISLYTLNTELEPAVGYADFETEDVTQWNNQKKWLEKSLIKDNNRWKIISYHRPLRPHRSSKAEGLLRYSDWSSLFYDYGVQLVIESDSHLVKYTHPIKPDPSGDEGFIVDSIHGTTYIGEGSWGAPTRVNDDDKSWTLDSASFWQFKLITVDADNLEIRTVKFGDENTDYDAQSVKEITQKQQNVDPKKIPDDLELWDSKVGVVLQL